SLINDDPSQRPPDAFAARRALTALRWPSAIERVAAPRAAKKAPSERPSAMRLSDETGGTLLDEWLGRRVVKLPLDAPTLARASLFARADHPALQVVLRVDRKNGAIWLAAPRGAPLTGKLPPPQAAVLREALDRLHDLGEAHGAVDESHVLMDE